MRLAVLFSGGKDSCAAMALASAYGHEIACLLSVVSENPDSYMFHTPAMNLVDLQAKASGYPLLMRKTKGLKENEINDLKLLIEDAINEYSIEGVVTGAINSIYQATRVQKVCDELGLWVFNPLWQVDEYEYMSWLLKNEFKIIISGVAAYPLDKSWLNKLLNNDLLIGLKTLSIDPGINIAGEGGEFESFVCWAPGWKHQVLIDDYEIDYESHNGRILPFKAHLEPYNSERGVDLDSMSPFSSDKKSSSGQVSNEGSGFLPLIISVCKEPLSELEFVKPLKKLLGGVVVRYNEVTQEFLSGYKRVIIAGTALKDDHYLNNIDSFSWVKDFEKPLVGICAGAQIIGVIYGGVIENKKEIGLINIKGYDPFPGSFEAYALHSHSVNPENFDKIAESGVSIQGFIRGRTAGIMFHPEVRNGPLLSMLFKYLEELPIKPPVDFSSYIK